MRESHACRRKTAISRIKDNFSHLTHRSGHFISDLLCIFSLLFITIVKAFKCLQSVQIVSVQRSSEYLRTFSATFGSLRKIVGNIRKWLGRFSEIPVMARQKSHAFDFEKVGRYTHLLQNTLQFKIASLSRCITMLR